MIGGACLHLLSAKNQSLLDRRNSFLLFNSLLDPGDLCPLHSTCQRLQHLQHKGG